METEKPLPEEIDEFVNAFYEIYGHLDEKRTVEHLWLQVVEEASSVAEAVREVNYVNVSSHLANTFCWICGLIAKCHKSKESIFHFEDDFSSIIWKKYPRECPLCENKPCQCLISKREIDRRSSEEKNEVYEEVRKRAERTIEDRIRNLDRLVDMFEDVYGPSYFIMPIEEITFHFTEEVGEVAEQIRELTTLEMYTGRTKEEDIKKIREEFMKELADVFSWMSGIAIKLNYLIENVTSILKKFDLLKNDVTRISFSDMIKKYYVREGKLVCTTCKEVPCNIKKHKKYYQIRE